MASAAASGVRASGSINGNCYCLSSLSLTLSSLPYSFFPSFFSFLFTLIYHSVSAVFRFTLHAHTHTLTHTRTTTKAPLVHQHPKKFELSRPLPLPLPASLSASSCCCSCTSCTLLLVFFPWNSLYTRFCVYVLVPRFKYCYYFWLSSLRLFVLFSFFFCGVSFFFVHKF